MIPAYNLGALCDPALDPEQIALIDCRDWERPREYSFAQLDASANAVARGLLRRGLSRGDRVAIVAANRAEFLSAYFGVMRAGMVAVPINHKFPQETVEFVLGDAAVRFAFCDTQRRRLLPADIEAVDVDSDWDAFLAPGAFEAVRPSQNETAMVLYTSGSTGRPKGVALSHQAHLWAVNARITRRPQSEHRLLVAAPLFHMNALGSSKFAIAAHASLVLLPQFDARHYIEAIERFGCSWLTSVPTMLAMVAREQALLERTDLSKVKMIRMGSAPVSQALLDDIKKWFPNADISNVYGTTEAGPVVFGPHPDGRRKPALALGWPRPGVELRLVDPEGRDAEQGVLWQKTPANMTGYLNLPEKTAEVLTVDGWYKSSDIFARDRDGCYYFVGRSDDMFVCGGENIYPGEVEQMLEKHPAIAQACVVPVPDEIKGQKPVAFVVSKGAAQPSEEEIQQYALAHAPAYQHPRKVVFLSRLPLASTNKVDRKALQVQAVTLWKAAAQRAQS